MFSLETKFFQYNYFQRLFLQGIGPILFFCCENDELSPIETIKIFASNLRKLGGRVDLNVWKESEHVGNEKIVFCLILCMKALMACVHMLSHYLKLERNFCVAFVLKQKCRHVTYIKIGVLSCLRILLSFTF